MTLTHLKRMIRMSLKTQIAEAVKTLAGVPSDFSSFRRMFAAALEKAGAPEDLVYEASDESYEGGPVFGAIWEAWTSIESEMRGIPSEERADEWLGMVEFYVHDAVIDMVDGFLNSMNYEPGRRVKKIDGSLLAKKVVDVMSSGTLGVAAPTKKSSARPVTMDETAAALKDRLESAGFDVTKEVMDGETTLVVYDSQQDQSTLVDQVEACLTSYGVKGQFFTPKSKVSYVDPTGQLKVLVGSRQADFGKPAVDVEITITSA